jgi:hypothetical protein
MPVPKKQTPSRLLCSCVEQENLETMWLWYALERRGNHKRDCEVSSMLARNPTVANISIKIEYTENIGGYLERIYLETRMGYH